MASPCRRRASKVARWAGVAGAGLLIGVAWAGLGVPSSWAAAHVETYAWIVANFERIMGGPPATGPADEPSADPSDARILAHFEPIMAGLPDDPPAGRPPEPPPGPSPKPLGRVPPSLPEPGVAGQALPPTPELKPRPADRSGEVLALLKDAVMTGPVAPPAVAAKAAQAAADAPPHEPELKPQPPAGDQIAAGARPHRRPAPAVVAEAGAIQAAASRGLASQDAAIEALRRELRARDAVIADLLQRVEQLEQRTVLSDAQLDHAVGGAGHPPTMRPPGLGATASTAAAAPGALAPSLPEPAPAQVAQAPNTEGQNQPAPTGDRAPPAQPGAPGQFRVDEAAAERALERTLVQEGVLLLPFGQAEIEPGFAYTRREDSVPAFFTEDGTTFIGQDKVRRNEFDANTTLRVGLPFDAQVEVDVPYRYVDQSVTTEVGGRSRDQTSDFGQGLGGVRIGAAKTLLQENGGWWPDLVARASWDTDTGKTQDNGVFLGGGFNEVTGSLTAVKRQDPLAFIGGVSYSKSFENDNVEPGDEIGFAVGTVLAASPETSLSFIFNQSFADETTIDGDRIDGSDEVIGTFTMGAATTLGRNMLLSVSGDIGLTDDAPDYAVGVSLPIRFNMPPY